MGEAMFLSRFTNTLDAKGRVSVPADFRTAVALEAIKHNDTFDGIVLWPSLDGKCLEGGGMALVRAHLEMLKKLKPYDNARIAFERAYFGDSFRLAFDASGRVSLPAELVEFSGLDKQVTFVGLGERFEVWDAEAYLAKARLVRKLAKDTRAILYAKTQSALAGQSVDT